MTAEEFLELLLEGGAIVSDVECTSEEIYLAQAEGRFYVDSNGYGYVWDTFE